MSAVELDRQPSSSCPSSSSSRSSTLLGSSSYLTGPRSPSPDHKYNDQQYNDPLLALSPPDILLAVSSLTSLRTLTLGGRIFGTVLLKTIMKEGTRLDSLRELTISENLSEAEFLLLRR